MPWDWATRLAAFRFCHRFRAVVRFMKKYVSALGLALRLGALQHCAVPAHTF